MKLLPALSAALVLLAACQAPPAPVNTPSSGADGTDTAGSYALGLSIGANLMKTHIAFDWAAFDKGLKEAYGGHSSLTADQVKTTVEASLTAARNRRAGENAVSEKAFLASNARKSGVTTTPSGLQYEVLAAGKGSSPTPGDVVTLRYQGTLVNGMVFEDTSDRKDPVVVPVAKLLPGFAEGVKLMAAGARYRLVVPSGLAYGAKGRGENIEPNVPLTFDVQLLSFEAVKK